MAEIFAVLARLNREHGRASGIAVCCIMAALVIGWYTALVTGYVHTVYVFST